MFMGELNETLHMYLHLIFTEINKKEANYIW